MAQPALRRIKPRRDDKRSRLFMRYFLSGMRMGALYQENQDLSKVKWNQSIFIHGRECVYIFLIMEISALPLWMRADFHGLSRGLKGCACASKKMICPTSVPISSVILWHRSYTTRASTHSVSPSVLVTPESAFRLGRVFGVDYFTM